MDFDRLLATVESLKFTVCYTALSGFSSVRSAIRQDETLINLIECVRESPDAVHEIERRFRKLLFDNPQPQYMHQHDVALTAYLYVLHQIDSGIARQLSAIALWCPNLWWAKRLAQHLKEQPEITPAS